MSANPISSLLPPAIPVAGQMQNTKPVAQNTAPAAAPVGGDSDGDNDGSGGGANITPPVNIKA